MSNFQRSLIKEIDRVYGGLEGFTFIMPSQRSIRWFEREVAQFYQKPVFSIQAKTIDELFREISGYEKLDHFEASSIIYQHLKQNDTYQESFSNFYAWSKAALQDFNEIDLYTSQAERLFEQLLDLNAINLRFSEGERGEFIASHQKFLQQLKAIYGFLKKQMYSEKKAYQGHYFQEAYKNLASYLNNNQNNYVFAGFNAFSTIEQDIVKQIVNRPDNYIFWDINTVLLEDPLHDASFFIRQYLQEWGFLKSKKIAPTFNTIKSTAQITLHGAAKNQGQSQLIASLIKNPSHTKNKALILSDEKLLDYLIHAIDFDSLSGVNVTLGQPLSLELFVELSVNYVQLLRKTKDHSKYALHLILPLIKHPLIDEHYQLKSLLDYAISRQYPYLSFEEINGFSKSFGTLIALPTKATEAVKNLHALCAHLAAPQKELFESVFEQLDKLIQRHSFLEADLDALAILLKEVILLEKIDFISNPFEDFQIMGILESRNLHFEEVLVSSLNEGFLPKGKTTSGFINFEVKKQFGLPTFKEKDAIFTYHFYRLIDSAKKVHLIYNTEAEVLEGGEPSRFIYQLKNDPHYKHLVREEASFLKLGSIDDSHFEIQKTTPIIDEIRAHLKRGVSPSALSTYIKDPFNYYKKYLVGVKETEKIEDHIPANLFGTLLHLAVEKTYQPLLNSRLTPESLTKSTKELAQYLDEACHEEAKGFEFSKGKGILVRNVLLKYLTQLIDLDKKRLVHEEPILLGLEEKLTIVLDSKNNGVEIQLKGTIDRVEQSSGIIQIIDYKTGAASASELSLTEEFKDQLLLPTKQKAFQLLMYAYMYHKKSACELPMSAQIISSRTDEFLPLKISTGSKTSRTTLTAADFEKLEKAIHQIAKELLDPQHPFIQKTESQY
jgi:ATP-dependent helicase/nuclease subunit B